MDLIVCIDEKGSCNLFDRVPIIWGGVVGIISKKARYKMKEFTDPLDLKFLQRLTDKKTGYDADMLKCPKCKEQRTRGDYISKNTGEHFHLCKKCRYADPKTIGTENVKWELGQGEIDRPKTIDLFESNINKE